MISPLFTCFAANSLFVVNQNACFRVCIIALARPNTFFATCIAMAAHSKKTVMVRIGRIIFRGLGSRFIAAFGEKFDSPNHLANCLLKTGYTVTKGLGIRRAAASNGTWPSGTMVRGT